MKMIGKAQILKAAADNFTSLGIKNVSVDDICDNLSISKDTFYEHYSEKQQLINDFLDAEFSAVFEEYARLQSSLQSPLAIMVRFNQFLMERLRSKNPVVLQDLRQFYPENYEVFFRLRERLVDLFADLLRDGIAQGYFRKEIDPVAIAELRVAQLESIFLPSPIAPPRPANYDQQMFEHFIYGIAGYLGMGRISGNASN